MRLRLLAASGALLLAPGLAAAATPAPAPAQPPPGQPREPILRSQTVAPLPGGLDQVLMVNDNNPELITGPGILLSTFPGQGRPVPEAHLDVALAGRFDLFSHHVYAGKPETVDSTLWLAVVAQPRGRQPVQLRLLEGSTSLSQSLDPAMAGAPFLPLPPLLAEGTSAAWAGPGSRVATELLKRQRSPELARSWTLAPDALSTLMVLPLPVRGLDPLLNGRNLQLRLESDGPVSLATLAAFGPNDRPPAPETWAALLDGGLSPKEHEPTPRGAPGRMIYSRVSGVQVGSVWRGTITSPGKSWLSADAAPISWPIASLERGRLGTEQVQTAELKAFYPGTAWAAHGNYGVEYDLTIPLRNPGSQPVQLQLALESPIKTDAPLGGLRFNATPVRSVMFRGPIEVAGLDVTPIPGGGPARASGRRRFHLVQRAGDQSPALGTVTLAPGASRNLRVRLIYPADATPPQVLSLLPVKQSAQQPASSSP
ncbi:DUF3370 domain-containing protein [Cyanobium sp. CH-040]|uniref:DUF3370 domain-containing protein n=1 Tax=Cyanobium sp. CH-040 TaxID=2823708 RepID=UPI0020CE880E|nr:DUF3370 domain-containing protein [Cyanobium sp. CH-040]